MVFSLDNPYTAQKTYGDYQRQAQTDSLAQRMGNQNIAASQQGMEQSAQMQPLKIQSTQVANQSGQLELAGKKIDTTMQLLSTVHDQASLDAAHQQAANLGIDSSNFTKVYDPVSTPQQIQQMKMQLTPYKDQITAQLTGMRFNAANGGMFDPVSPSPAPLSSMMGISNGSAPASSPSPSLSQQIAPSDNTGYLSSDDAALLGPAPQTAAQQAPQNLSGEEYLKTLNPQASSLVKATASGDSPWPTGRVAATPAGAKLIAAVRQYDPQANAQTAMALQKWNNGPDASKVTSLDAAAIHTVALSKLADALNNDDVPAFNSLANAWAKQTGNPAPTNFETLKNIVGGEIVAGITGSGGTGEDRDKAQRSIDAAGSPAQLKQAIQVIQSALGGQFRARRQQYMAGTRRTDFESRFLTPEAQDFYKTNMPDSGGSKAAPAAGQTIDWNDF